MTVQLYSVTPRRRCPPPDLIIIDVGTETKELFSVLRAPDLLMAPDEDMLMEFIIGSLMYQDEAQYTLAFNVLEEVERALSLALDDDKYRIANAVVRFGEHLRQELDRLKVYQRGFLAYQFQQWLGHDLVLCRLIPPTLAR